MNEIAVIFLDDIGLLGITGNRPVLLNTPYVPGTGDIVGFLELKQADGSAAMFRVENRFASFVGGSLTAFHLTLRFQADASFVHG